MTVVNVHAAKTHLSRLLDDVAAGEDVIIAKHGKPIARLVPLEQDKPKRQLGTLDGQGRIPDHFDDPLPDEVLREFLGG